MLSLTEEEHVAILSEIDKETSLQFHLLVKRHEILNQKIGNCPNCNGKKYTDYRHTVIEYTSTWLIGLHKKEITFDWRY